MNSTKHVAIVGAGASGLFLAKKLSGDPRFNVTVFEKNRQVGAKLRASGGGKANLFNRDIRPEHYNQPAFMAELLRKFSSEQLDRQFDEWGLVTVSDEEGRVYPATQYAQTAVDVLTQYDSANVRIETGYTVRNIAYQHGKWTIDDYPTAFDNLVLASGSPAGMIAKNQRDYNCYLHCISLACKPPQPSLAGFKLLDYPKSLSGCRAKAIVSLFQKKKLIHREFGEITFKDDGVSGIVVMNLSAYYRRLPTTQNCRIEINLAYWDEKFNFRHYLYKNQSVIGVLHPKLAALYQQRPFDIQRLAFPIDDTYPMEGAQVCHGGVDLSEIDGAFGSKKYTNLHLLGEMLDVDGICGGYNLFFAFASASIVAEQLKSI